jgi:hypothetical protein
MHTQWFLVRLEWPSPDESASEHHALSFHTDLKRPEVMATANPHTLRIRVTDDVLLLRALLVFSSGLSYALGLAMPDIPEMGHFVPNNLVRGHRHHFSRNRSVSSNAIPLLMYNALQPDLSIVGMISPYQDCATAFARPPLDHSRVAPVSACPVLRPRWCPSHSPYRALDCCLPVAAHRRLSLHFREGLSFVHDYTHFEVQ